MTARRTKAQPQTGDEGGLAVFYVDCQLAAFPGLRFHEAMQAKMIPGVRHKSPPSLEALYKPEDERKLAAHKKKVRALLSKLDPGAPKPPDKGLLTLDIGLRVKTYRSGFVCGPFDGAHDR